MGPELECCAIEVLEAVDKAASSEWESPSEAHLEMTVEQLNESI
jgi:hypothetical protein